MSEKLLETDDGKVWTADTFAIERGFSLDEIEFATWLQEKFGVRGYERMQQLWRMRDASIRRHRSGSRPEGGDVAGLT